ncbi:MAG: hypothetical protein Q4F69_08600 [Bacteroidia bacterium]|nr:hypothetical protein [Bacteroidia bacterium]
MISKQKEKKMAMSFDEKYEDAIKRLKEIGKPDYPRCQLDYYADFVELLALFSGKDGVSYGDVQDQFFGEPDEKTDAGKKDKDESFLKEIFSRIDERISLYAKSYPFEKKDNALLLKEDISENEKYYVLLLIASQLSIFESFNSDLTTDFETLSYESLKSYLPNNAVVKQFGENTEYKGNAVTKIRTLAKDIGFSLNNYAISQIAINNNQERGLDVIGWLPFEDKCQNKVIILGQCACGKKYEYKQIETRRFASYFDFYTTEPQHSLFVPYSLINIRENKFYGDEIKALVFERKRIVTLLQGNNIYNSLLSKSLVERCINS